MVLLSKKINNLGLQREIFGVEGKVDLLFVFFVAGAVNILFLLSPLLFPRYPKKKFLIFFSNLGMQRRHTRMQER